MTNMTNENFPFQHALCIYSKAVREILPDSKVHGANIGPTWGRQDPGGPHVGHTNPAIWAALNWGVLCQKQVSRAGTSDQIPQCLWDVITCTCPWVWYTPNPDVLCRQCFCRTYGYKQRVLMHRHQGLNVRHGLCHIYMRYLYIYMSCL